jgi:hypothetical protein
VEIVVVLLVVAAVVAAAVVTVFVGVVFHAVTSERCPRCESADFYRDFRDSVNYCPECEHCWPFKHVIF